MNRTSSVWIRKWSRTSSAAVSKWHRLEKSHNPTPFTPYPSFLPAVRVCHDPDLIAVCHLLAFAVQSSSQHGILDALLAGYNVDIVKAVPIVDNALILPTPIGLPITLNISAIAAIAVKGQVKVDGITSIRDIISSPRKLSIAVDVRPR